MKQQKWLNLMLALVLPCAAAMAQPAAGPDSDLPLGQPVSPASVGLPPGAAEVVRLSESGTSEDVILSYIHDANSRFNLSADQILYLRDIGCSSSVISAMLNRDHELQAQTPNYNYEQKLYSPVNSGAVAPQPIPEAAPPEEQPAPPPPAASVAPASPAYVSTPPPDVGYFYDDLAPYGTWVELNGLGWCWQPRVVVLNHGWRPYCDSGYWVYTDAGWYWQSSYSWGWAPFHYGRWQMHPRCGWVWMPDRVWGPSWVVWRSEGDHCGWAPLPPHAVFQAGIGWRFNGVSVAVGFDFGLRPDHYTFVAMRDFNNHDLGHHHLPPTEVTRIYNHTTIINNYTVNNNKTIVNQGIKVDRVAAATHTQIRPVPIRDVPAGSRGTSLTQASSKSSSAVYRPQLAPPTHRTTMVAQKVDDRHPVIQHAPVAATRTATAAANSARPAANSSRAPQPAYGQNHQATAPQKPAYRQENGSRASTPTAPTYSAPSSSRPPNANAPRPQEGSHYSPPARSANEVPPGQGRSARPTPEANNSGDYHPKSYRQAAEVHALPPQTARPVPPAEPQRNNSGNHSQKD